MKVQLSITLDVDEDVAKDIKGDGLKAIKENLECHIGKVVSLRRSSVSVYYHPRDRFFIINDGMNHAKLPLYLVDRMINSPSFVGRFVQGCMDVTSLIEVLDE